VDEAFIMEKGFPSHVRDIIVVGSWRLLREVELAAATLSQLTFVEDPAAKDGQACGIATLLLPVSKADVRAGQVTFSSLQLPESLVPGCRRQALGLQRPCTPCVGGARRPPHSAHRRH
jgi:hypothetical protein